MAAWRASGRQDCRRRVSSSPSSSCDGRLVVGDVVHPILPRRLVVVVLLLAMLRFALVVRSSRLWATTLSPLLWGPASASPLLFRAVRFSSSLFRGCRRLGELVVAVLRRVVAGLAIVLEWTFCGHLSSLSRARPHLNTFPAGPSPVFSRAWLSYFLFL